MAKETWTKPTIHSIKVDTWGGVAYLLACMISGRMVNAMPFTMETPQGLYWKKYMVAQEGTRQPGTV